MNYDTREWQSHVSILSCWLYFSLQASDSSERFEVGHLCDASWELCRDRDVRLLNTAKGWLDYERRSKVAFVCDSFAFRSGGGLQRCTTTVVPYLFRPV